MSGGKGRRRWRVLLHCEDRRRDAATIWALKVLLTLQGFEVLVSNRRTFRTYDRWFDPDVVILSHATAAWRAEELKEKAKSAKLVVLPTEGAIFSRHNVVQCYSGTNVLEGSRRRREYTRYIDRVLMWGHANAAAVVEEGIYDERQIAVIGGPRLDVYKSGCFDDLMAASREGAVCGFASSVAALNLYDRRNPVEFLDHVRQTGSGNNFQADESLEDYYWYAAAGLRLQLEFLYGSSGKDLEISLRPHIYEHESHYEFVERAVPGVHLSVAVEPFYAWLARVRTLVVVRSTTIADSLVAGVPVIALQPLMKDLHQHLRGPDIDMPFLPYCHAPASLEEALEMAKRGCDGTLAAASMEDPGLAAAMRDYYSWPSEGFALLKVGTEVMALLGEEVPVDYPALEALTRRVALRRYQASEYAKDVVKGLQWELLPPEARPGSLYTSRYAHFHPWHRAERVFGEQLAASVWQSASSLQRSRQAVPGGASQSPY